MNRFQNTHSKHNGEWNSVMFTNDLTNVRFITYCLSSAMPQCIATVREYKTMHGAEIFIFAGSESGMK
jgi:hypothetical protein